MGRRSNTVMVQAPMSCVVCGKRGFIEMPDEAYDRWMAGELLGVAWPDAPPATREVLISGTHPACWSKLVGKEPK